ncbi:MAG: GGDEF domain-containing protein [Candidatus Pacebacteria bacterium]|nr:GGDEF domain-containing protein [Candidatus Paceibacterota bacterium]
MKRQSDPQSCVALQRENKKLKKRVEQLEHDLIHDELTQLKTRKYFVESVKSRLKFLFPLRDKHRELDTSGRRRHVGFLFCDIDFFKKVNDTLGHAAGDHVLKRVSRTLEETVRDIDIVARFGGEEIVVALLDVSKEEARQVAEKLRAGIEGLSFDEYPKLNVTVSIGVSSTEDEVIDEDKQEGRIDRMFDEHMRRSDSAVYVAKDTGRNRVVVWSSEIEDRLHNKTVRAKILGAFRRKER